jgi:hypothetical protein
VIAGVVIAGVGLSFALVAFGTAVQLSSPADLQGRVYSAADTLLGTAQTVSIALGAALITVIDYRVEIVAMAFVTGAGGLVLLSAGVREPQ